MQLGMIDPGRFSAIKVRQDSKQGRVDGAARPDALRAPGLARDELSTALCAMVKKGTVPMIGAAASTSNQAASACATISGTIAGQTMHLLSTACARCCAASAASARSPALRRARALRTTSRLGPPCSPRWQLESAGHRRTERCRRRLARAGAGTAGAATRCVTGRKP